MQNFKYVFRSVPEYTNFIKFGTFHILMLAVAILVSLIIIKNLKENRRIEIFIGAVLLLQQISLYSWYFTNNYNILTESLPLYHCRIAIISLGIGFIFNKENLIKLGGYWGVIGSFFAIAMPNLDPFLFPHITGISFFIGHLFLLWGSIYALFIRKVGMNSIDIKSILLFTNVYCIFMYIFNYMVGSNYGYMRLSPIALGSQLHPILYAIVVILISNIAISIEYIIMNNSTNKKELSYIYNQYKESVLSFINKYGVTSK